MAENWTCRVCETVCDGEYCPICGAVRQASAFDPSWVVPLDPTVEDDGDDKQTEAIEREELKRKLKRRASLYYILFLVIGIPTVFIYTIYFSAETDYFTSIFSWTGFLDLTRILLFIFGTVSFIATRNGGENAVESTLRMLILAVLAGCANLFVVFCGFCLYWVQFVACLLLVPAAILACSLLYNLSKRMQTL